MVVVQILLLVQMVLYNVDLTLHYHTFLLERKETNQDALYTIGVVKGRREIYCIVSLVMFTCVLIVTQHFTLALT